mmetsp:Transcript_115880/g.328415  ORF Transcript_115880/g.328415 Transcript_115880/m.328415 type:complete len:257 (+) Transcript_115880:421-1191(+)
MVTLPLRMTLESKVMSPSMTSFLQLTSDGTPWGTIFSMASTNLQRPSSLMFGGTFWHAGASSIRKSGVSTYASERRARRSLVVFTGAKRERGTRMAEAPSKHWMAAPMAVSSWRTLVDSLSRGSTVLAFFITGRGRVPPCISNSCLSACRFTHRLFVLKYLYLPTFWNSFSSASGHCADSRSRRPPVFLSHARCPPFLSASVRVATSIMNGALDSAKYVRSLRSSTAPRLSELETNMYLNPMPSSLSSVPLPSIAG